MEVDDEIEARRAQAPREREVVDEPSQPARALGDDDRVEMRVVPDDRRGRRLDEIGDVRVGKAAPEGRDGGRREDDVADEAQPDEQNLHPATPLGRTSGQGSTVASSMSMTGMSSLIG